MRLAHFLLMPNKATGELQNPSFREKSNIPGLFYLFYLFTSLNAHISEIAKCFGTPVGFSGTRSLSSLASSWLDQVTQQAQHAS